MKLKEIFDLAIKMGRAADLRSDKAIENQLKKIARNFSHLSEEEKKHYPKEKLDNPYPDSLIHWGDFDQEIKKILVTIDATEGKLLIGRELGVDLVLAHHPTGKSLSLLPDAMKLQMYLYAKWGVPINIVEGMMRKRIEEVRRSIHAVNNFLVPDSARLLNMPLMNIHTPTDNLVLEFIEKRLKEKRPKYVGSVLKMLNEIPEYQEAAFRGSAPRIFAGSAKNHAGKIIASEITGGTDGAEKIYPHLAGAGIGTIISMHQSENYRKEAEKAFINVVIASHIASDSLGMNLFVDELEKRGIKILATGGFIRVRR